jgi:GNAT superfamily N-acetyltransferase
LNTKTYGAERKCDEFGFASPRLGLRAPRGNAVQFLILTMSSLTFTRLAPTDTATIKLIAHWYLNEWSIPPKDTIQSLSNFPKTGIPFQMVMSLGGKPIATGGVYNKVNLLKVEPRFEAYGPWLAVIYTSKGHRQKGFGTLLCKKIDEIAKGMGVKEMFLYTQTAESMYRKLGWSEMERIEYKGKDTVVMRRRLNT